jgi:hypothetical protein
MTSINILLFVCIGMVFIEVYPLLLMAIAVASMGVSLFSRLM